MKTDISCKGKYKIGYGGKSSQIIIDLPSNTPSWFFSGDDTSTEASIDVEELLGDMRFSDFVHFQIKKKGRRLVVSYPGAVTRFMRGITREEHEEPLERSLHLLAQIVNASIKHRTLEVQSTLA